MAGAGHISIKVPTMIIWGREDEVFDAATFSSRFKQMMSHAEGPHRATGRHFLVSGAEIAWLIGSFWIGRTISRPDDEWRQDYRQTGSFGPAIAFTFTEDRIVHHPESRPTARV
jgi:hypothetical protein